MLRRRIHGDPVVADLVWGQNLVVYHQPTASALMGDRHEIRVIDFVHVRGDCRQLLGFWQHLFSRVTADYVPRRHVFCWRNQNEVCSHSVDRLLYQ